MQLRTYTGIEFELYTNILNEAKKHFTASFRLTADSTVYIGIDKTIVTRRWFWRHRTIYRDYITITLGEKLTLNLLTSSSALSQSYDLVDPTSVDRLLFDLRTYDGR